MIRKWQGQMPKVREMNVLWALTLGLKTFQHKSRTVEGVVVERDVNGVNTPKPHDSKLMNMFNNCVRVRMLCAM
jgi:hypothetical protein